MSRPENSTRRRRTGFLRLLHELNRELGLTILIVTHDVTVASGAGRTIAIRDGRMSTETVRRDAPRAVERAMGAGGASAVIGLPSETHRESILIDRVGRLQLPQEAIARVPFNGRADVRISDDHVEIWPAEDTLDRPRNRASVSTACNEPATNHTRGGVAWDW